MTPMVPIMLFGWIPVALVIFSMVPARRAVIAAYLFAWLFLPVAGYKVEGIPPYDKNYATNLGVLLCVVLFDAAQFRSLRLKLIDIPMILWCLTPMASSLSNGYGAYDGLSSIVKITTTYGVPYLIGRLYFTDLASARELAIGVFVGGLVYAPFCWYEMRMSPQLHTMLYGFHQHSFEQTRRFGGWRPVVFMQHGLMVAHWMMAATVAGAWLWAGGAVRALRRVPVSVLVTVLTATTVLCRSVGALVMLVLGLGALMVARTLRTPILIGAIACIPLAYVGLQLSGLGAPVQDAIVSLSESAGEDRVQSLSFRLYNERILLQRAMEQPLFGWAGWGLSRVTDDEGRDISITDGMWIIYLGVYGVVGLVLLYAWMVAPPILVAWRLHRVRLPLVLTAPALALACIVALFGVDTIPNCMPNPIYFLASGALASLAVCPASRLIGAAPIMVARTAPTVGPAPVRAPSAPQGAIVRQRPA